MQLDLRQHLGPDPGLPVVDDDRFEQPGVEHFHQVLVFQRVGHQHDPDRRLAGFFQLLVQILQAVVIAARRPHVHGAPGKRLRRGQFGNAGAGQHDFSDWFLVGDGDEISQLQTLVGDCQVAHRDVANTADDPRQQLVARGRDDVNGQRPLAELCSVFLVQVALELAHAVRRNAALAPAVVEIERAAVGNQNANHPSLNHLLEIALPGLDRKRQLARLGGSLCRAWRRRIGGDAEKG